MYQCALTKNMTCMQPMYNSKIWKTLAINGLGLWSQCFHTCPSLFKSWCLMTWAIRNLNMQSEMIAAPEVKRFRLLCFKSHLIPAQMERELPQYQTSLVADCSPYDHTLFPDPSDEILAQQLNMLMCHWIFVVSLHIISVMLGNTIVPLCNC